MLKNQWSITNPNFNTAFHTSIIDVVVLFIATAGTFFCLVEDSVRFTQTLGISLGVSFLGLRAFNLLIACDEWARGEIKGIVTTIASIGSIIYLATFLPKGAENVWITFAFTYFFLSVVRCYIGKEIEKQRLNPIKYTGRRSCVNREKSA